MMRPMVAFWLAHWHIDCTPSALQFPYGIGPKDEEFTVEGEVRRFSFIRYQDVAAVIGEAK